MRYIDADKLIDDLEHDIAIDQDHILYVGIDMREKELIQFDKDCKQNCIDMLSKAPTADVRENVKGQWLDYYNNPLKSYFDGRYSAHCSVCGYHPEYEEEMHSANFCPNCGAQMRQVTGKLKNSEDSTLPTR